MSRGEERFGGITIDLEHGVPNLIDSYNEENPDPYHHMRDGSSQKGMLTPVHPPQ